MSYPRHVETARLTLRPASPDDTDALFAILSDPEGWWFDPQARHTEPGRTHAYLTRAAQRWDEGLSYWTVLETASGRVIGIGGAQRHASGAWNVYYRLATSAWGEGYGTELAEAGRAAALPVDPDVPGIAWVAEHNTPSRRVAERLGLIDRGSFVDGSDGQQRIAYADRPLDGFVAGA